MNIGFEPYRTPDDEGAVDRIKAFCNSRGLTNKDVKLTRKDGFVRVVVIKDGCKCKI